MCQKKPGLRCAKHANRAVKAAFKKKNKAIKFYETEPTQENLEKSSEARDAHMLAVDMYYSSNLLLSQITKTSKNFEIYEFLNKTLKGLRKAQTDEDNTTPLIIGNKVSQKDPKLKDIESALTVVKRQGNKTLLWDESNPNTFIVFNHSSSERETIHTEMLGIYNSKPDLQWAVWLAHKKPVFHKI